MSTGSTTTAAILSDLIAIDTVSANSNLPFVEHVADYLRDHKIDVTLVHNEERTKANLFATIGPEGNGGIALSGHSDVVPVEGQDWSSDPFKALEKDGRIYGRGACDMKGFIAATLALVPEMIEADPKTPLHLVYSYDEELGCVGIGTLISEIAKSLPLPEIAIIGEPTDMKLVNSHKGIAAYETELTGLEAHSSATHVGVSAIFHGAELVGFLDRLAREMAERGPFAHDFDPPYTSLSVGLIDGGTAVNIIPKSCRISYEFRPVPGADPEAVKARIAAFIEDDLLPRMRQRFPDAAVVTTENAAAPPLVPTENSAAEDLVRKITGANRAGTVSFATEAGHFQSTGVSAVIIGPGSIDQAHKPDEYVEIDQLAECEDFLRKVIAHAAARPKG
ncbi:MAG: acetylornithine deacetylase [Alphaproteobacteria bacterium]|nr:acetylornithine deacetylase [Alphaproteobacteria bacterium]